MAKILIAWTGASTRDPREIAALSSTEHKAFLVKMKTEITRHWHVDNGVLVSDGQEPYLATTTEYGDFELWVDWQLGPLGDSGIYLRGVPQVQIWDYTNAAKFDRGADKGSGGLWNNTTHERFPKQVADTPIGQWNRMLIRMVGQYVTVVLNDKTVVENEIFENYFDHSRPIFMRGPIYLQTHGAETRFRNIFIRELSPSESHEQLAKMRSEDGFQSLFNGHDLSDWMALWVTTMSRTGRSCVDRVAKEILLRKICTTTLSHDSNSSSRQVVITGWRFARLHPKQSLRMRVSNYKSLIMGRHNTLTSNPSSITAACTDWFPPCVATCALPVSGMMKK